MSGDMAKNLADLEARANTIPSMGGRALADALREIAAAAPAGTTIVEVGAWMGAGTAQLAIGLLEAGNHHSVTIHAFDRWIASPDEAKKALARGQAIDEGGDVLPVVRGTLDEFGVDIAYHRGDILDASWDGQPISVYIDDAAKTPMAFTQVLHTFGPSWIPGETVVVLMDYRYWRKARVGLKWLYRYQQWLVEQHPESFRPWVGKSAPKSKLSVAIFDYVAPLDFAAIAASRKARSLIRRERMVRMVGRLVRRAR